jgi:hypothetical protein
MIDPTPAIGGTPDQAETKRYREQLPRPESDLRMELARKFERHEFIVVRGFLTDALDRLGLMMKDQLQAITNLGRPVRKVTAPFDSGNTPDVNATVIAAMVRSAELPVILVTHSKGSIDTLTALVRDPAIQEKIAGWVSIQGAMQGSTVADFLVGTRANQLSLVEAAKRAALSVVFDVLFRGSIGALDALRTKDRVDYLQRNAAQIQNIVQRIPTVSFGSAAPTSRSTLRQVTDPFFKSEPLNDGLVSVQRTVIPGARIVHDLDGPDHGNAVMAVSGQDWDRIRLTYALLSRL